MSPVLPIRAVWQAALSRKDASLWAVQLSVLWSDGGQQEAVNSQAPLTKLCLDVRLDYDRKGKWSRLVPKRTEQEGKRVLAWQVLCSGVCSKQIAMDRRPPPSGLPGTMFSKLVLHLSVTA